MYVSNVGNWNSHQDTQEREEVLGIRVAQQCARESHGKGKELRLSIHVPVQKLSVGFLLYSTLNPIPQISMRIN